MKRTVLFLVESLAGGGAEKVLLTLLKNLDYTKFEVTLCCVTDVGVYVKQLPKSVHYLSVLPDFKSLSLWGKLCYKMKYHLIYHWMPLRYVYRFFIPQDRQVEVAFVEGFATNLLSHSTSKHSKKITWMHSNPAKHHWTAALYKGIGEEVRAYNNYTRIVTVSDMVKEAFLSVFKGVTTPVLTLYNPIDATEIRAKADEIFPSLRTGWEPSATHVLRLVSLGRLSYEKAYDRLLRIVKRLRDEHFIFELWLLGDGPERVSLASYIKDNQLEDCVTLWGFQSNPYVFLKRSDLFVCSSISEGYSTAVTESLILGIPIITTDCSGMHELLGNNEYGVITDNSEESLYLGLKKLLSDPSLLEAYRQKAVKRGDDFSLSSLVEPIETLFLS